MSSCSAARAHCPCTVWQARSESELIPAAKVRPAVVLQSAFSFGLPSKLDSAPQGAKSHRQLLVAFSTCQNIAVGSSMKCMLSVMRTQLHQVAMAVSLNAEKARHPSEFLVY